MSEEFTDGRELGFNTSMFFNNELSQVKQQINFCGSVNYGTQFHNLYSESMAETKYRNIFYGFQDTIEIFAIDCMQSPLNSTLGQVSD